MIPLSYLQGWTAHAPWPDLRQVEQDLIICRALCDLFNSKKLTGKIAFRGGTAINKLQFAKPLRYSEDIDLVQTQAEPIGTLIEGVRDALSWLGTCNYERARHSIHLVYKFAPEAGDGVPLKLKVEINTREHTNLFDLKSYPFDVKNDWFTGSTEIVSFEPAELFGTKLRALLQRKKNRDLFDLYEGLQQLQLVPAQVIESFHHYLGLENLAITRAIAEERMLQKLNRSLTEDIAPLLPIGVNYTEADAITAFGKVWIEFIQQLPGDPWKSSEKVIQAIRKATIPTLLSGVYE